MSTTPWKVDTPLEPGRTLLLEASAGTGKTWQIEGLVVRLVAEYGIPIEEILVITFTNAATAELRDRVRKRLVAAREALDSEDEPKDPILHWIWRDKALRESRRKAISLALSAFDLAPISTIHGFSQRMLDQLAFESGQEPGLELLADPGELLEQRVDDAIASVYAHATEEELAVLADMGWSREALGKAAKAMTKAVAPVLEPDPRGQELPTEPLGVARAWLAAVAEVLAWLDGAAGQAALEAYRAEVRKGGPKRINRLGAKTVEDYSARLRPWLRSGALRSFEGRSKLDTALKYFAEDGLRGQWRSTTDELLAFGGYELASRVQALCDLQDTLWPLPLAGFAAGVRAYVDEELVRKGQLTYSTMLSRLAERIEAQGGAEGALARAIRSRFQVALVDEFQDTDGVQWPVLRAVFAHSERRLMMIGDPKQAIYAFRGADVHVYLDAAQVADDRFTMETNWRSDKAYIDAMNHVWAAGSDAFDLQGVDYVEVGHAPDHEAPRTRKLPPVGGRERRPFEARWVDGNTLETDGVAIGNKAVGANACAELAAREIAVLLESDMELAESVGEGEPERWRALRPGDIAVLVRTNKQAERVRSHLDRLGIPSVSAGRGSVLQSPALDWLCAWLDAVAEPSRDRPARLLATTPLFGWTARQLADALAAADAVDASAAEPFGRWDHWLQSIHQWAELWSKRGFVRVFEGALDEYGVVQRLLGAEQGERHATDLRHLVELCHAEERRTRLGPSGLASWLRASREALSKSGEDEAQALRLESDARAVQLVTIHKSKGLEFPVVLLPFGWADYEPKENGSPLEWHARVGDRSEIRLNLHAKGTEERERAFETHAREERQEQRRLLYVALTRARHHCIAWLGPLGSAGLDPGSYALGQLLLRERDAAGAPVAGGTVPAFKSKGRIKKPEKLEALALENAETEATIRARLDALQQGSGGTVGWFHEPPPTSRERVAPDVEDQGAIAALPWPSGRRMRSPWQVSSYSSMVSGRTFDASEPQRPEELRALTDPSVEDREAESLVPVELGEPESRLPELDQPIPSRELRGGTETGTWVHAVFEHLDFQQGQALDGRDLATLAADLGARNGVRVEAQHSLITELIPDMLDTPLDGGRTGLPEGYTLRSLAHRDRLDELGFDLRLGAGNRWVHGSEEATRVNEEGARLALESRLGDEDWGGRPWLRALLERSQAEGRPVLPRIAGILTGFIDLTLRVEDPSVAGGRRYYLSDYKTNWIAPPHRRGDSRLYHYARPWMDWEMAHHGYHLQALLYSVALHRMLRQRVEGYNYDTHVGGHLYLFLRGMVGPETPRPDGTALGVYHDRWPASVVLGLDAALAGRPTDEIQALVRERGGEG